MNEPGTALPNTGNPAAAVPTIRQAWLAAQLTPAAWGVLSSLALRETARPVAPPSAVRAAAGASPTAMQSCGPEQAMPRYRVGAALAPAPPLVGGAVRAVHVAPPSALPTIVAAS